MRMAPDRHDRLVAFVSHLPQVASTALMGLAATEEADEPEILLLAAGGFRDLTRLAASNPALWSDILLANREAIAEAIDLYVARLVALRRGIVGGARRRRRGHLRPGEARAAAPGRQAAGARGRGRAAGRAFPTVPVRSPNSPRRSANGEVNIEDLQIVHSPEGGRGTVHLTVAADGRVVGRPRS